MRGPRSTVLARACGGGAVSAVLGVIAVVAVLVSGVGAAQTGSAAHLAVDGGVLQVFEFDGPVVEPPE
jgi:hypothetical protein